MNQQIVLSYCMGYGASVRSMSRWLPIDQLADRNLPISSALKQLTSQESVLHRHYLDCV
jgi:hypothetical protein